MKLHFTQTSDLIFSGPIPPISGQAHNEKKYIRSFNLSLISSTHKIPDILL